MPDLLRTAVVVLLVALLAGCGGQGDVAAGPATPAVTGSAETSTPPDAVPERPAPPRSVRIEALGLDEQLVELGIAGSGELEVPEDPSRVGWFSGGGRPGGPGPTVVVGHVDSTEGPAVFSRLPELVAGDEVDVTSQDGTTTRYVVREAQTFSQDPGDFPTEAVFGATPDDELRLITCTGPYDRSVGRYTQNRVVFAVAA